MKPVSPVLKDLKNKEIIFAENQSEYQNLPALQFEDGHIVTRWKLSFKERLKVLFTGDVYLLVQNFKSPLQPVYLQTDKPEWTNEP